jgi:hypothetical protein
MMGRLGRAGPEDMALRQRMMAAEAQRGQGPQFQGSGRPEWQSVGAKEAIRRVSPGGPIQAMSSAMGQTMPMGVRPGTGAQGGYYASQPGAMGTFARATGARAPEQPRWMGRG